jgi:hypothetical protein
MLLILLKNNKKYRITKKPENINNNRLFKNQLKMDYNHKLQQTKGDTKHFCFHTISGEKKPYTCMN